MKKSQKIIASVIILASLTTGTYALDFAQVKSTLSEISSAGTAQIGKFGEVLTSLFDTDGYIKMEFIKDGSITAAKINDTEIQKRISQTCPSDKAIQSISQDGTVTCVGSGSLTGGVSGTANLNPTTNVLPKSDGTTFVDSSIYDNGNVGIGTSSPRRSLDVNGEIIAQNRLTLAQDSGTSSKTWHLDNSNGKFRIFDQPNINTGGTERMIIDTNGNVGIGTSSPSAKLDVNGDIAIPFYGYLKTNATNHNSRNILSPRWTSGIGDHLDLYVPGADQAENNLVMTLVENGNVGIGTSSPSAKLEVNGRVKTLAITGKYLNDNMLQDHQNGNVTLNALGQNIFVGYKNTDKILFYGGNVSGVGTERMRINSDGRVGIGTSSPSAKLHVYGGSDSSASGKTSGFVTIGDVNSTNISIDNNEIMARDNGSTSSLYIQNDGGNTYFGENVYAYAFIYRSDRRLKKNIKTVKNSLEKINKLRGVTFNWKKGGRKDMGVIAQEVEKVLPELVDTDEKGIKSVEYGNFIGVFIEGIKELYNKVMGNTDRIVELERENNELKNRIDDLEKKMEILESKIGGLNK